MPLSLDACMPEAGALDMLKRVRTPALSQMELERVLTSYLAALAVVDEKCLKLQETNTRVLALEIALTDLLSCIKAGRVEHVGDHTIHTAQISTTTVDRLSALLKKE